MSKRIILSIATLFIAISSFAVDRVITYDQLPQNAKNFIEKYSNCFSLNTFEK